MTSQSRQSQVPIAVVGIGCRFPGGANNPEDLWSLLLEGRRAWSEVPSDRFNWKSFYHPDPSASGATNHRGGHFLEQNVRAFDADFFGVPPSEADSLDPQTRILLETSYEALENAGISLEAIRGSDTGVFVATFSRDYERMQYRDPDNFAQYTMVGSGEALVANRISYTFDLKGPSFTLDTGCSGSLVALHQACQSLRTNETSLVLVGGTNLILGPESMIPMSLARALNADGRCYSFDSRGSGYGRGEGVATVALKRLDDAIQAGDTIRAVVLGTGVNQDGRTSGIMLPSQNAQQALLQSVLHAASLSPSDIGYLEAHGTGTVAGDGAEIESVLSSFSQRDRETPLYIGSIKSNIGHCGSASGIAGLIKTILVLEKGLIPPTVDLQEPKDEVKSTSMIKIPTQVVHWANAKTSRRASVNSFGYGGTNAHAILQQAPTTPSIDLATVSSPRLLQTSSTDTPHNVSRQDEDNIEALTLPPSAFLLTLSAHSSKSLEKLIQNTAQWARKNQHSHTSLHDLAFTLSARRTCLKWRYSLVANSLAEVTSILTKTPLRPQKSFERTTVVWVFTGQGAQWFGMGRELISAASVFRESLTRSEEFLREYGADWSLVEELQKNKETSRINESYIAQPATTALQIALIDLLSSFGVKPDVTMGHSSGEISAAYAASILTHQNALKIAYFRGFTSKLARTTLGSKGAMLAVAAGKDTIVPMIDQVSGGKVSIACINSPSSLTLSGDEEGILELKSILDKKSVFNRRLAVDTAYHSHHMLAIGEEYKTLLGDIPYNDVSHGTTYVSTVTGSTKESGFGASYWVENLVSVVEFLGALTTVRRLRSKSPSSVCAVLEVGPHNALGGPIRQTFSALEDNFSWTYTPLLERSRDALSTFLKAMGVLFESGCSVNFGDLHQLSSSGRIPAVIQDLPAYPWTRSKEFWHESRISEQYRLRRHPNHELLGACVTSVNPNEPVWRNLLSADKVPWLREHVVENITLLPGSAYISMAVEALRQTVNLYPKRKGWFSLKDVTFERALVVPESPLKIETQLSLRELAHSEHNKGGWYFFRITSLSTDGEWQSNCHGSIKVDTLVEGTDTDQTHHLAGEHADHKSKQGYLHDTCSNTLSRDDIYSQLHSVGNEYGALFKTMTSMVMSGSDAEANIIIPDIASSMPEKFMEPSLIHPIILDSIHQVPLLLYHSNVSRSPVVPVCIEEITISSKILSTPGTSLTATTSIAKLGFSSASADVVAFQTSGHDTEPWITIKGLELQGIGGERPASNESMAAESVHHILLGLDVDFMEADQVKASSEPSQTEYEEFEDMQKTMATAAAYFMRSLVGTMEPQAVSSAHQHYSLLYGWMTKYTESSACSELVKDLGSDDALLLLKKLRDLGAQGEMLARMCENLEAVITGTTDPLSLMLQDGLLPQFYAEDQSVLRCVEHLAGYTKSLLFKQSSVKVLEIGAGTGGTTLPLFLACEGAVSSFEQYCFTDISSGFFESARARLEKWTDMLTFKKLDIEKDSLQQGFDASSYDLIIATDVIHATSPLKDVLHNIKSLLKPSGKFALIEITNFSPYLNAIFGLLPGWWRGIDDGRTDHPLLTVDDWSHRLQSASFSGAALVVDDYDGPANQHSLVVTSPHRPDTGSALPPIRILDYSGSKLASYLNDHFRGNDHDSSIQEWDCTVERKDKIQLVVDTAVHPILSHPSEEVFQRIKSLLKHTNNVIWLSRCDGTSSPDCSMVSGFARVARTENSDLKLVVLHIQDQDTTEPSLILTTVLKLIRSSFASSQPAQELDYTLQKGTLNIQRLVPDTNPSRIFSTRRSELSTVEQSFQELDRPLKLQVSKSGALDGLKFVTDATPSLPLAPDEIEIKAQAFGLNFKDVLVAMGQLKNLDMVGECVGVVTRVGKDSTARFNVGDRVLGWASTTYASRPRLKQLNAYPIPGDMPFNIAVSIPVAFMTAYYALVNLARLSKGQSILIHAASGGVGQAAVQLAQHLGADIYATAGSNDKRAHIVRRYGLPESKVFSSRSGSFKQGIMKATNGQGVDIVVNPLAKDLLKDSWSCVARFGTFVEIGKTDILNREQLPMKQFDRNVSFCSVDLALAFEHRPAMMQDVMGRVMSMFREGKLEPVDPVTVLPLSEIEGAFRLLQSRQHMGKVVLEVEDGATVKALPSSPERLRLHNEGTYIIAGGSGSLGKQIIKLMGDRGAANIVVLTRKEYSKNARESVELDLGTPETKVRFLTCDIADETQVEAAIHQVRQNFPEIRGVIQSAMVLNNKMIEHMSADEYNQAAAPKRLGTLNLFKALSALHYDFFVMLSSTITILGTPAQANYAAGCAYQDSLAQSPPYHNTHYMSLNLGMVESSDIITQNSMVKDYLERAGCVPISMKNFFQLLEYSMSSQARIDDCRQIITGFSGDSMHLADSFGLSQRPLFTHIRPSSAMRDVGNVRSALSDIPSSLKNAKDAEEANSIVLEALALKLSSLLSVELVELTPDRSIRTLGIDSLITIELRGWITNTTHSQIKTAEILDSASIGDLAALVTQRSSYLSADWPGNGQTKNATPHTENQRLPTIPLPELAESLEHYMESVSSFCSTQQMQSLQKLAAEFQSPGGVGQVLHQRLVERTKDENLDDWLYDLYERDTWTKRRVPLNPYGHFFGVFQTPGVSNSQAKQVAVVIQAALSYKSQLDAGKVKPDAVDGQAIDMSLQQWVFNTYLEPGVGHDRIQKTASSNHVVILSNGHIFRLDSRTSNTPLTLVEDAIERVLKESTTKKPSAATFTADERDSWAKIHKELMTAHPQNSAVLRMIESSAFVICLDPESPSTSSGRVTQFLLSNPGNRWSDKSLQFVVCRNGSTAMVPEHAMLDGDCVNQLFETVRNSILASAQPPAIASASQSSDGNGVKLEEYELTLTPELHSHIDRVNDMFASTVSPVEYNHFTYTGFGAKLCSQHGCATNATFQLVIQLAARIYFNIQHPCIEAVSTRSFHRGRLDFMPTTVPPVVSFCTAASTSSSSSDDPHPRPALRQLLLTATRTLTNIRTNTARGRGFRNHFLALRQILRADEPLPAFFQHESFSAIIPGKISTDCADWGGMLSEAGFHRPGEGKVWVHYEVKDDRCNFAIKAPVGETAGFYARLVEAGDVIKGLLEMGT